jgi:hypothetical protein
MATSTETTVRNVILTAIQDIATTELGFEKTNGNVRAYPLEFAGRDEDAKVEYLMSDVSGESEKQLRCWAVKVTAQDNLFADFEANAYRNYGILVRGYYWPEEPNTAIDHARKVREAIKDLETSLSATVDRTLDTSQGEPRLEPAPDAIECNEMCVIDFEMLAEKKGADY